MGSYVFPTEESMFRAVRGWINYGLPVANNPAGYEIQILLKGFNFAAQIFKSHGAVTYLVAIALTQLVLYLRG
jgi:hypothetical protein